MEAAIDHVAMERSIEHSMDSLQHVAPADRNLSIGFGKAAPPIMIFLLGSELTEPGIQRMAKALDFRLSRLQLL